MTNTELDLVYDIYKELVKIRILLEEQKDRREVEKMTSEESNARRICCPMCDKKKCEREAGDCDVKIYLKNKAESEGEK